MLLYDIDGQNLDITNRMKCAQSLDAFKCETDVGRWRLEWFVGEKDIKDENPSCERGENREKNDVDSGGSESDGKSSREKEKGTVWQRECQ